MNSNSLTLADGSQAFTLERAEGYSAASRAIPNARDAEVTCIEEALAQGGISNAKHVVEIGAGQGFATRVILNNLSERGKVTAVEPSEHMALKAPNDNRLTKIISSLTSANLLKDSADMIVSVAAFHHIPNKFQTLLECRSILRDGGKIVLVDVNHGTEAQRWFDFVVRPHCPSSHEADFLDESFVRVLAERAGLSHLTSYVHPTPWYFQNHDQMVTYARDLFCITDSSPDIPGLIQQYLTPCIQEGYLAMQWSLGVHILQKQNMDS